MTGLVVIVVLHLVVDVVAGSVMALLPSLQDRKGLSDAAMTVLVATFVISSSIAQPLAGRIADRHDARSVAALGAVAAAVLLSPLVLAPTAAVLYLLVAAGGLAMAAFHPSASVVARHSGPARADLAIGLFAGGGAVGAALGPAIALGSLPHGGVTAALVLGLPAAAAGLLALRLLPTSPPTERRARGRRLTWTPTLVQLTIAGTLTATAGVSFAAGYPGWMTDHGLRPDNPAIGWTLALFSGTGAVSGVAATWLWRERRPSRLMAGSVGLAALPLLATLTLAPGSPASLVAIAAAGLLLGAGIPATVALTSELAPGNVAAATGVLLGLTSGLAGAAYLVIGNLATLTGTGPALALAFLGLVPAAAITAASLACGPGNLLDRLRATTGCTCPIDRRQQLATAR